MAYKVAAIIFKELVILVGCLMLWPIALGVVTAKADGYLPNISYVITQILAALVAPGVNWFTIVALIMAPYVAIQTIRVFRWSRRSAVGRKWAALYFFVLFTICGSWFGWRAWDLFYFMYALGDMPDEIVQFFQIEGSSLLWFMVCVVLALVSLVKFIKLSVAQKK